MHTHEATGGSLLSLIINKQKSINDHASLLSKQAKQPDTAALQKCIYVSVRTRVRVSVSASARLHDMPV